VDGGPLPPFLPGQFLTLELTIAGQSRPVLRTYSLSDYPLGAGAPDHYRLSIKREPAPQGLDVPPGLASGFLHDHVQQGSRLKVRPPAGDFVLETTGTGAIVLVSNGVGITPMLAMVKAAVVQCPQRPIWFVHGCRNSENHAFSQELAELARSHPNLKLHVAYSRPLPGDQGRYQSQGYVDGDLLSRLVSGPASYYLCGSPAFMDSLILSLQQAGVEPSAIRFERFSQAPRSAAQQGADSVEAAPVTPCEVRFRRSGLSVSWDGSQPEQSLLELAESAGLHPRCACRSGVCGTCATRVASGSVAYLAEPAAAVTAGTALICIARPASETLDLDQ
jgi:uncharacterized protein